MNNIYTDLTIVRERVEEYTKEVGYEHNNPALYLKSIDSHLVDLEKVTNNFLDIDNTIGSVTYHALPESIRVLLHYQLEALQREIVGLEHSIERNLKWIDDVISNHKESQL